MTETELSIPAHVLAQAPWSISKAGVAEKCSAQFAYKYGPKKIKELVVYQAATVGVAVHKVLELMLDGTPIKLAFQMALDQGGLTTNEIEEVKTFWDQCDRFVKKMVAFQKKNGVTVHSRFIERRWALNPDFTPCGFFDKTGLFRGVVDFAMLTAANDLVIIDHKSGAEKAMDTYDAQFRSYCLLALAKFPKLRGVQTAVNFVLPDHLTWNTYISAEKIRDEYRPWLIAYLTKSCEGLLTEPKPLVGWYCKYCGYKPICTAHGGTGTVPTPVPEPEPAAQT